MRTFLLLSLSAAAFAITPTAQADWPMARHDRLRTSTGDAASEIETPALAWRYYLGGTLGREQYVAFDIEADGTKEILFLMGGALIAKSPNDSVVWETQALDLSRIDGLYDLDGDGTLELIASAVAGRIYVIRPTDGEVLWVLPAGIVGNVGNVRFADFDGDGVLDLYFAELACGSTGALGDVGQAFSFAADLTAPTLLFALEQGARDYTCGRNDTIVDIDGDGELEVVAQGRFHFYIYSTTDGSLELVSENIGSIPYGLATTIIADVDGDDRPELICFTDNNYAPPTNSRRVFLMDFVPGDTPVFELRWERAAGDVLNDRHGWAPGGVTDLLNDGSLEIVTSFYDDDGAGWQTFVLNAADGTELAVTNTGPFRGLADLDDDPSMEILTSNGDAGITVYTYAEGALTPMFSGERMQVLTVRDQESHRLAGKRTQMLVVDVDHNDVNELIVQRTLEGGARELVAFRVDRDPAELIARLPIEEDVSLVTFEPASGVTADYEQLMVARSDGYMWILDDEFQATNARAGGEIPSRGLRIGGFYSGRGAFGPVPVAADLDGVEGTEIVTRDSRRVLVRLNVRNASLVEPPIVDWQVSNVTLPTLANMAGDDTPEVAVGIGRNILLLNAADASTLWRRSVGTLTRRLAYDLVPADLSGDGVIDLAYQLRENAGGTVINNVVNGVDGTLLWATEYETRVAGSGLGASAIGDAGNDGSLDVLTCPRNTFTWLDGATGAAGDTADGGYPSHPILFDVDADGTNEVLASGGVYGVRAFETDMTAIWSDTEGLHTRIQGAAVMCPDGARYVQGFHNSANVGVWSADDGTLISTVAVRGGVFYADPSAAPEGPGVVGSAVISTDLTGNGEPSALIPSSDGNLYAIRPCGEVALVWAMDFRFPVGQAILADTDGDGLDEIVVTVADGFLYGIDQEVLPAPAFVVENDGSGPATEETDIDSLITRSTLWANWVAVEGATEYEYAVITPGGAFLTDPGFSNVGSETSAQADDLPLVVGGRYQFAVRAIGPDGASSEALSDGIVVLADPCDDCERGQRCVAHLCEADPCFGVTCDRGESCQEGMCVRGDAGMSMPDAGATGDAGMAMMTPESKGCCSVAPGVGRARTSWVAMFGIVAAFLVRRRRR